MVVFATSVGASNDFKHRTRAGWLKVKVPLLCSIIIKHYLR